MGISEETQKDIVTRVLAEADPCRIILFGSAASGTMTSDSDIDLLVLLDATANPAQDSTRIRRKLTGLGYPFDVIVMAKERFEESKNVIGGIAFPASKYGKVIYETA
ncbi:MAG: nucleotidyltransferase domain-containing protein [Candidatus Hydrogenedentales bacterium]|jgi:predicted nucleotidyltransferase